MRTQMSLALQYVFMNMVATVLMAIFYKVYNVKSTIDIREYAFRSMEKYQPIMDKEMDEFIGTNK